MLPPVLCCLLSGADHRLVAWDALTLKEVWRTKLDAKAPLTSLTYSQRCVCVGGRRAGAARGRSTAERVAQRHETVMWLADHPVCLRAFKVHRERIHR